MDPEKEVSAEDKAASLSVSEIDARNGYTSVVIDPKTERALVWKFDIRILPVLACMYLFNSLDKSNLGNAKTDGLEAGLGMAGTNDYNIILSIFFIPYVLTAPFLGIAGRSLAQIGYCL